MMYKSYHNHCYTKHERCTIIAYDFLWQCKQCKTLKNDKQFTRNLTDTQSLRTTFHGSASTAKLKNWSVAHAAIDVYQKMPLHSHARITLLLFK